MLSLIRDYFSYLKLRFKKKDNIKKFSYNDFSTIGYISKVYDGDTVHIIFEYKGELRKESCRLYGIDTPEIKSDNKEERLMAIEAKVFLSDLILNKYKKIQFLKHDKYGRPLVNIYHKKNRKISINDLIVINGYGKKYFGGKKEGF